MEVRIESMICLWDDKIPVMFLEFVNLLTLARTLPRSTNLTGSSFTASAATISTCTNATRATPKW